MHHCHSSVAADERWTWLMCCGLPLKSMLGICIEAYTNNLSMATEQVREHVYAHSAYVGLTGVIAIPQ